MGVSLYVQAVDPAGVGLIASDPGAALTVLMADGWSADQLGWAAFGLVAGVNGLDWLASSGFKPGELQVASERAKNQLIAASNGVDRAVLESRFDNAVFGDPIGPEPLPEDKVWVVEAAVELMKLIQSTFESELQLSWAIL